MLGVSYLFDRTSPRRRKREFHKLLELRPDYRFDPLLDPQRVVDFFNGVVKEEESDDRRHRGRAASARRRGSPRASSARPRAAPAADRRALRTAFVSRLNFVPFGAGQFQNGQRRKGWLFFGAEAVLAAVSVGAFATNFALYGPTPHRRCTADAVRSGIECPPATSITARRTRRARCSASRSSAAACSSRSRSGASSTPSGTTSREVPLPTHRRSRRAPAPSGGPAPHVFARRPRRRLGILKGQHHGDTQNSRPGQGDRRSTGSTRRSRRSGAARTPTWRSPIRRWRTATRTSTSTAASSTWRPPRRTPRSSSTARSDSKHKLAHDDRIRIGSGRAASSRSTISRAPTEPATRRRSGAELASYKKLYEFSDKLMAELRAARRCSTSCWTS